MALDALAQYAGVTPSVDAVLQPLTATLPTASVLHLPPPSSPWRSLQGLHVFLTTLATLHSSIKPHPYSLLLRFGDEHTARFYGTRTWDDAVACVQQFRPRQCLRRISWPGIKRRLASYHAAVVSPQTGLASLCSAAVTFFFSFLTIAWSKEIPEPTRPIFTNF